MVLGYRWSFWSHNAGFSVLCNDPSVLKCFSADVLQIKTSVNYPIPAHNFVTTQSLKKSHVAAEKDIGLTTQQGWTVMVISVYYVLFLLYVYTLAVFLISFNHVDRFQSLCERPCPTEQWSLALSYTTADFS